MKRNLHIILAVVLALAGFTAQAAGIDLQALAAQHPDILAGLSGLAMMGAVKTQGTELYFLDPEDNSVIEVGCVITITGLTAARDQIETTCLDSGARTYEAGMATPGPASFTINADPKDPSHVRLHELYVAGTKVDWALGWSDGVAPPTVATDELVLPTTRSWIAFNGYVSDFPFDFALNAVVASNLTVQVSDFPIWAVKA